MTSVETAWNRFRRIVVTPYWCEGSPLAWSVDAQIGIAHFALNGDVGKFNLSWWLLNRKAPPLDARVYETTPIQWVILKAPGIRFGPDSLTDIAARATLKEWKWFVSHAPAHRLLGNGLTLEHLQHLL